MSSSTVDPAGEPIPTSAVLMSSAKHIASRCRNENLAFLKCKKDDPNPEKCLDKGQQVTRCVLSLKKCWSSPLLKWDSTREGFCTESGSFPPVVMLKDLHQRCTKEMDAYVGCMYYYTDEFDLCRKEQKEFEKACPLELCISRCCA
ncbi:unnamed protein product [Camellia sinensis]